MKKIISLLSLFTLLWLYGYSQEKYQNMNLYWYKHTEADSSQRIYLSLFNEAEVKMYGLPPKAIFGVVRDMNRPITFDNVIINDKFLWIFHKVIKERFAYRPDVQAEGDKQKNGQVYIIDNRCKTRQNVPIQDIIGWFPVREQIILTEDYKPNPNYQVFTADGIFSLPDFVCTALMTELKKKDAPIVGKEEEE